MNWRGTSSCVGATVESTVLRRAFGSSIFSVTLTRATPRGLSFTLVCESW